MIRHEDIDDGPITSKCHKIWCFPCIIPCNFLFHPCRKAVSGSKRRYQKDGFDLDLVYLDPRIIIHGFPAHGLEHIYRNPRYEIKRFMDLKHPDKYRVYNFCCEPGRGYDPAVFHGRVERYPFKDHCTPPLETMVAFANSAKYWLDQDPENVVNFHCKAGKGRAGLMACVLMIRTGIAQSAKEAISIYDKKRVTNNKGLTVTSQRKFVMFYELLWRKHWKYLGNIGEVPGEKPVTSYPTSAGCTQWKIPTQPEFHISKIEILNLPSKFHGQQLDRLRIRICKGTNFLPEDLYDSGILPPPSTGSLIRTCDLSSSPVTVQGNFKVQVDYTTGGLFGGGGKTKQVLMLWHNTLFMKTSSSSLDFDVDQLDVKKTFRRLDTLTLRLHFSRSSSSSSSSVSSGSVSSTSSSSSPRHRKKEEEEEEEEDDEDDEDDRRRRGGGGGAARSIVVKRDASREAILGGGGGGRGGGGRGGGRERGMESGSEYGSECESDREEGSSSSSHGGNGEGGEGRGRGKKNTTQKKNKNQSKNKKNNDQSAAESTELEMTDVVVQLK